MLFDYERLTHDPDLTAAEARLLDAYRAAEASMGLAEQEVESGQVRNARAARAAISAARWTLIAAAAALDPSVILEDPEPDAGSVPVVTTEGEADG